MIIFVNGKIGGGSPPCGEPYFRLPNTPFVEQAVGFFGEGDTTFFTKIDHRILSSSQEREEEGYAYAERYLHHINDEKSIKIIAHSMGCAFAEGVARWFSDKGLTVSHIIHINAYQSGNMKVETRVKRRIDFQYTNDIVIRVPFLSDTRPMPNAITIRKKSPLWIRRRHRGPIYPASTEFWNCVAEVSFY